MRYRETETEVTMPMAVEILKRALVAELFLRVDQGPGKYGNGRQGIVPG
jgi:hypothetical protein